MIKRLKIYFLPLILISTTLGTGKVFGWPWSLDMWKQPSIWPYEMPIAYPNGSVFKDQNIKQTEMTRENFEAITKDSVPPTETSLQKGEKLFQNNCSPCHGMGGKGDGPVIKRGFYPVDLTASQTQARTDGYIYAYIRYGGKILMPSYRDNVSSDEAWSIVNYVRKLQGKINITEEKGK
ncbi:MAG: c-type cytochrome [Ignavibacteriales bacterium]